jgi:hypothetical protein
MYRIAVINSVALAYEFKTHELFRALDRANRVIDVEALSPEALVAKLDEVMRAPPKLCVEPAERMPGRKSAEAFANRLKQVFVPQA